MANNILLNEDAMELLYQFTIIQGRAVVNADLMPCPRCGRYSMSADLYTNALSRKIERCMVCDECGQNEALEAAGMNEVLELYEWALPKNVFAANKEDEEDEALEETESVAD